jgi:hypothetical protein
MAALAPAEAERVAVCLALLRAMAERDGAAVAVLLDGEPDLAWSVAWLLLGVLEVATGGAAGWIGRGQAHVRRMLADPGGG